MTNTANNHLLACSSIQEASVDIRANDVSLIINNSEQIINDQFCADAITFDEADHSNSVPTSALTQPSTELPLALSQTQGTEADSNSSSGNPKVNWNEHFTQSTGALDNIVESDWLIDGMIPLQGLVCTYAPSASLKSFVALDMSLHICIGKDWHKKNVEKGAVVYIAGEGRQGYNLRQAAFNQYHELKGVDNFFISDHAFDLINPDDVEQLIQNLKQIEEEFGTIRMLVVDTLARNFGNGDENKTKDMNAFIANVTKIQREMSFCVHLIHHTSKGDATKARGNGALRAALDTEIMITPEKDELGRNKSVTLEWMKMKDAEPPIPLKLRPLKITLPKKNKLNDEMSSLVIDATHNTFHLAVVSLEKFVVTEIKLMGSMKENKFNLVKHVLSKVFDHYFTSIEEDCIEILDKRSEELVFSFEQVAQLYGATPKKDRIESFLGKGRLLEKLDNGDYVFRFKCGKDNDSDIFKVMKQQTFFEKENFMKVISNGLLDSFTYDRIKKVKL